MAFGKDLPPNVVLLPSASHDLERILHRNRAEFSRLWADLVRLGTGTLPSQGRKKLKGVDAFQFDAGRYRIVYYRRDAEYVIWAVFAKPEQLKYLKRFHS